jgi:hypothetical protein
MNRASVPINENRHLRAPTCASVPGGMTRPARGKRDAANDRKSDRRRSRAHRTATRGHARIEGHEGDETRLLP